MSQSKFSGPRKFTLRYQQFEITVVEMKRGIENMLKFYSLIFKGTLRYQYEISRNDCIEVQQKLLSAHAPSHIQPSVLKL